MHHFYCSFEFKWWYLMFQWITWNLVKTLLIENEKLLSVQAYITRYSFFCSFVRLYVCFCCFSSTNFFAIKKLYNYCVNCGARVGEKKNTNNSLLIGGHSMEFKCKKRSVLVWILCKSFYSCTFFHKTATVNEKKNASNWTLIWRCISVCAPPTDMIKEIVGLFRCCCWCCCCQKVNVWLLRAAHVLRVLHRTHKIELFFIYYLYIWLWCLAQASENIKEK